MGIFPACNVAIFDASLSVAITSWPASARQLPDTNPTYPQPITANFTPALLLRFRFLLSPKHRVSILADSHPQQKPIRPHSVAYVVGATATRSEPSARKQWTAAG